jgi:hypothetical protein
MSVIERPHTFCFSKNEIRYVFNVDEPDRAGLFVEVKLQYAAIGEISFTELMTWQLKPATDGKVYIYLQAYLDSLCNYLVPDPAENVNNANAQCMQFYIEWREVEDADTNPDWQTGESLHVRTAIKGGIERHKMSRNNFFVNYIDADKPFLTWTPSPRFVFPDEPVFLSFLNLDSGELATGSKIKMNYVLQDGTTGSSVLTDVIEGLLVHIKADAVTMAVDTTTANKCVYYDVSIVADDETTILINPFRFYIEYRPLYAWYDLLYHNSTGGIDTARVKGETDIAYTRNTAEGEGGLDVDDWTTTTKPHEKLFSNIVLQRNYKGDIGFLRTKNRQEAGIELLASKSVYMLIDDRYVPVVNVQSSQKLGTARDKIQSFPVEWQLSESNESFTPAAQTFGLGVDNETY